MEWITATDQQLIQICYFEDCSLDDKYEAARELQTRSFSPSTMLTDLVMMWGTGMTEGQISQELGVSVNKVKGLLAKHRLYTKRVRKVI